MIIAEINAKYYWSAKKGITEQLYKIVDRRANVFCKGRFDIDIFTVNDKIKNKH